MNPIFMNPIFADPSIKIGFMKIGFIDGGITSYLLLPPTILQLPPKMFFAIPLRVFMHMPRCHDGDCDAA